MVALRKAGRLRQKTTMVCNTQRAKRTSRHHRFCPPISMCANSSCTLCATRCRRIGDPWWRCCICLMGAWPSTMTSSKRIMEKVLPPFLCCFLYLSPVMGAVVPQILAELIFRRAVINPYTLRPVMGLHGDQMDEVLLYMAGEDVKIAGLHAKARLLKRERCCTCTRRTH